jgi:D-alanyl-lipoteichoic acid acyltransferase DltB (MBOAT superfamily)
MADAILAPVVDAVYAHPGAFASIDVATAVLAFSGQIYYDFAGYSLSAIGLALCFGFEFPDNFRHPYGARGFSDFWRRWHITLSSWLRDYLYIPLGGNRAGEARAMRNLLLTMLIGGLWHGASWMFVLWGGLHGLYLAAERLWRRGADAAGAQPGLTLLTFVAVTLAWIPFRSPDPATAAAIFSGLWRTAASEVLEPVSRALAAAAMALTFAWHCASRDGSLERHFGSWRAATQACALGGCLIAIYLVSGGDSRAFIYFQF